MNGKRSPLRIASKSLAISLLLVGFYYVNALAGEIIVKGRLVEMFCQAGRHHFRVELANGNRYVQHPSVYIKLVKLGLYEEKCVELVEYIPELLPKSAATYVIPMDTSCKDRVKPFFKIRPKRAKTADWEEQVDAWAEECPPRRVMQGQ